MILKNGEVNDKLIYIGILFKIIIFYKYNIYLFILINIFVMVKI